MIPYSKPKLSDLYTLSQSKLLENHTLHSGPNFYLYLSNMLVSCCYLCADLNFSLMFSQNKVKNTEEKNYKYWYLLFILQERTYIQFVLEVLKSMCIKKDNSMSCGDKFISGLLEKNSSNYEVQFITVLIRNNSKLKGPC